MWEEIAKGGIMMIPLLVCSLLALTITIERAFSLQKKKIINPELIDNIKDFEKNKDRELIRSICRKNRNSFSSIITYGIENINLSKDELKEGIQEKGKQEVRNLERGLGILETIAGIAPLLGLLGTVLGMITVFKSISIEGIGRTTALSQGIYEALYTTVAGLSIAIFSQIFYNFYTHKSEDIISEMEQYSTTFLNKLKSS